MRTLSISWTRIVTVALGLTAGLSIAATPATRPTTKPTAAPAWPPQVSAYRWGSSPDANAAFAQWLGVDNVWAEDFEPNETWDNIQYPGWQLYPWQKWVEAGKDRRLILSIPMLPGGWDRKGPAKGIAANEKVSLKAGAAGAYNKYFQMLAEKLALHKLQNSVLRIGWEMNGGWYTWRASDDPKAWAAYYRQIVKTMRGVKGAKDLQFVWNPATDFLQFPAENCYPGDDVVDVIGVDVYDQSWLKDAYPIPAGATPEESLRRQKKVWDEWIWGGNHGLKFWNEFTQKHKKPLAICEWGVCDRKDGKGGGDNPFFIQQMHDFIMNRSNRVMWHCYFDVEAGDGKHQLSPGKDGKFQSLFPKSAAKFKELFGGATPTTQPIAEAK